MHVTLVPFIGPSGEQKTKPTQHSVTELRGRGIQPDAIVCRSDAPISAELKRKISSLCDVPVDAVVNAADAGNLYEIPLILHDEGLDGVICRILHFADRSIDLTEWEGLVERVEAATRPAVAPQDRRRVVRPAVGEAHRSTVDELDGAVPHRTVLHHAGLPTGAAAGQRRPRPCGSPAPRG